jgi:outer membrane protein assembly factor BamB
MGKLFIACLVLVFAVQAYSQDFAQWRGKNRDGIYNETGLLKTWPAEGPKLLWHFDELGEGHSSAAITSDMVYTSGTSNGNGFVIALDNSGKTIWKTEYGKEWMESWNGVRTTPMISEGKIYIESGYGLVACMDAKSGKILWSVDLIKDYGAQNIQWGMTENLLLDGEKLICTPGGTDANVIAIDKKTGKLIWKSKANGEKSAYCSPIAIIYGGKSIIVTHTANHIIGINSADGTLLWMYSWPNQWSVHPNTPLFQNGQLFCSSGYGQGAVMLQLADDGASVKELWTNKTLDCQLGGFVQVEGRIYGAGSASRKWVCLDWKTGKELGLSTELGKQGNVIYADGLLYCYSEDGNVLLVQPKADGFGIISKFKVPYGEKQHWAHLVIANKKLYVRHGASLMVYSIAAN